MKKLKNKNVFDRFLNRSPVFKGKTILLILLLFSGLLVTNGFALPVSNEVFQQAQIVVSGTVTDVNGIALPSVTIQEKGTNNGVLTDFDGNFTIEVSSTESILEFSYVGMKSHSIIVGGNTTMNVQMEEDAASLDEVVVVGYGTQKKADVTGSVVRVSTEKTEDQPNHNVVQSLQGRVAGLNVTSPGRPGENPAINIRGVNSISAGNDPLIVVDGIIYNGNLSDFSPNDIATIDVLKDASATAVYGSRASNGVLLLTTKTGKTEKPRINFNTYHGVQQVDQLIDVLDGPGYLQKVIDFREATGLEANPENIDEYLTVVEAENRREDLTTNWLDQVLRPGIISNYHLDVSGRTEKTSYYFSGNYFKQEGIVKNDNFDRITLDLNLTNNITDWYSLAVKSKFSVRDLSGNPADLTQAYRQSPYGNFYDENGPGGYALLPTGDPVGQHPMLNTLADQRNINTSLWGALSSILEVPFIPGLKWTLNASANIRNSYNYQFLDNQATSAGQVQNGIGTKLETKNFDWTVDNILNYNRNFDDIHSLDVTLLYSRESRFLDFSSLYGANFFTQGLGYNNLELAEVQRVDSNFEDQNSVGYMGRMNYSFDNRYAMTLTARRDGFSGFSQNNKYATFPSVALAWTATNENFLYDSSWLDYLKLRLSYGENGNQAVGRYRSLARMGSNQYLFGGSTATTTSVNSMANNDLTWETTTSTNIGIDFTVFNQRINGSVDVYSSDTENLLLLRALPRITGFGSVFTNIGEVHNEGLELSLNSVNVKKENLNWESGFVFALNRNRIVSLTGQDADADGIEDDDVGNNWFIGKPINTIYGYETDGIYQSNDNDIPSGFEPGDFRIVDNNNDGEITSDDRTILGTEFPNYSFSISNTLQFKEFTFYMLINSIQGGDGYYVGDNNNTRNVNAPFTQFTERFNVQDVPYWTPSRPSNEYPRVNYNASFPHPILEDRSFVRIQDVNLSYNFNENFLDKMNLNGLRLYIGAKNLYTFTKWTGYDPENATTLSDFPFLKTYTAGLDFKF